MGAVSVPGCVHLAWWWWHCERALGCVGLSERVLVRLSRSVSLLEWTLRLPFPRCVSG